MVLSLNIYGFCLLVYFLGFFPMHFSNLIFLHNCDDINL